MSASDLTQKDKTKDLAASIVHIPADACKILETYSGIPPNDVVDHVIAIVR